MAIKKIAPYKFKVSCIIPIWKEHIIYKVLAKFDKPYVDEIVLVVDEPTEEIKRAIEIGKNKAVPPTTLINNKKRMGIGYAIREGLKYSLQKLYDVVVIMAGNGKDNPQEIPRLLKKIEEGYDYVQGSRFLPGGGHEKTPLLRGLFIRLWPHIWCILTGAKCTDITNGFRAYKLSILNDKRINIDQEWLNHYALEYYIHYKTITLGYKFTEAPVTKKYMFRHRGGYSKIMPYKDWIHIVMPLILLKFGAKK
ncbi:MAG: glycosyltransferase family 2 protein [Nitrososphaeria archaeon]